MTDRRVRCAQCGAFLVAIVAAVFTGAAYAETGPASQISAEVWLGLFATVLFSLVTGYAKGLERRIGVIEKHQREQPRLAALEVEQRQQQTQISLLREKLASEHPSRAETAEHRAYVEGKLNRIDDRFDALLVELRKPK